MMLYLKQAFRSLQKNRLFSIFNIVGFAIGFTVCVIIALYVYHEKNVNSFFTDANRTYRLISPDGENTVFDKDIAPILKEQYPEIKRLATFSYLSDEGLTTLLKVEDKFMTVTQMTSADKEFFNLAGINILASSTGEPFADKNSIVLSKSSALKLFGHYNIVGKPIQIFGDNFIVSAIAEDIPSNATFSADFYLNDDNAELGFGQNCDADGCYLVREIFFSAEQGTDIAALAQKMNANFPKNRTNITEVTLQPVKSIYFSAPPQDEYSFDSHKRGNEKMLWILITIASLTIFMSLFNYINYTISKQLQTLKQMGIRMAAGAGRKQIFQYYLVEVGLSIFISFVLAIIFAILALPLAEQLFQVDLNISWLLTPEVCLLFIALLVVVVLLSAWFPVSLISKSNVTSLLGKAPKNIRANSLSKIMSIAQLVISIVLLSSLFLINKQISFVKTADYGFETEQLLRIGIPYQYKNYSVLKEAYSKLPFITDLSLTSHSPGAGWSRSSAKNEEGEEVMINTMQVDPNFVNTFKIDVLQGRNGTEADMNKGILITETTLKELGWDNFEGRKLFDKDVVGVVNEFQYNSMHTLINPVAFMYSDRYYSALNVRLSPGNFSEQLSQMKKVWTQIDIDYPFDFQFYNEYFNSMYQKEEIEARALSLFSIIAFIITCLGLLAQIIQITERRVKEIGIRKINGASIREVVRMLNREFVLTVIASFVIATPVAYYVAQQWLQDFAYKTSISWWIFALAGFIALAITLLTVSWQSWRAATRNPVEALRYE